MATKTLSSWHYLKDGVQHGPVSGAALKALAAGGELRPGDRVWREGLSEWIEAGKVRGLFPEAAPRQTETARVATPAAAIGASSTHVKPTTTRRRKRARLWGVGVGFLLVLAGAGGFEIWNHHETDKQMTAATAEKNSVASAPPQVPASLRQSGESPSRLPAATAGKNSVASAPPQIPTSRPQSPESPSHLDEAKAWLKLAYDDAVKVNPDDATDHLDLLVLVGGALANAGDKPGAINTAEQLIDRATRATSKAADFDRIGAVSILVSVGSTQRAASLLDAFEGDVVKRLNASPAYSAGFDDILNLRWSIGAIAVQRVRLGDLHGADAIIMKQPTPDDRGVCHCQLAEILFAVNKPNEAKQAIETANKEADSPDSKMAKPVSDKTYSVFLGAGEFDAAYQTRSFEADVNGMAWKLVNTLWFVRHFGPQDTATAVSRSMCAKIEKLPDSDFKSPSNYVDLAREQAFEARDFEGALRTMRRAAPKIAAMKPGNRKRVLIEAAAVYARAGDMPSFHQTLAAAEQITETPRFESADFTRQMVGLAYFNVARALAATGKFDEAIEMAKKCPDTIIGHEIATELARAGFLDRAIALPQWQPLRLEELRPFVWAYVSGGHDLTPLKRYALANNNPEWRGTVELAAAEALMNKRDSILHIAPPR